MYDPGNINQSILLPFHTSLYTLTVYISYNKTATCKKNVALNEHSRWMVIVA